MRFKKRYLLLLIPFVLAGAFRLEYFTMRDTDETIIRQLSEKGVSGVKAYDYTVGDRNMHYIHVGDAGQPLVILVHGTPGSCNNYVSYLENDDLRQATQLVAVDRPGLGYSDFGDTEPSVEQQAAMLRPILDRHPAETVLLVGHSYGGPVVARMAMDYPEKIDGMIIVAGSIAPELEPREWWRGPLDWWLLRWMWPPAFRVANQEIMALYEELNLMLPLWAQVRCETVVFQGEQDKLVDPGNAQFADQMLVHASRKDIRMIAGGNHFILWSKVDDIVGELVRMAQASPTIEP